MDADSEPWKKLQLSLERPYKDEHGVPIPTLYDINQNGEQFFERKESAAEILAQNLKRIFTERGLNFFDKTQHGNLADIISTTRVEAKDDDNDEAENEPRQMTSEELRDMIFKIAEPLNIVQGELTEAAGLLDAILPSSTATFNPAVPSIRQSIPTGQPPAPALLTATFVKKPPPIISVDAFNAQLAIGDKDEALRKAADIFKTAADKMESGRVKGEKYWADALKIRRGNWGLVPAPLPPGAASGKGADKSSKDFMVTYGLEESSQVFRRRAIAWMAESHQSSDDIIFPHRQNTRLRVCLVQTDHEGKAHTTYSTPHTEESTTLDGLLQNAQREMAEQEIFSYLVNEASNLPTAAANVSERLIAIDAALGTELRFELIEAGDISGPSTGLHQPICDLIYHSLHALLLRRHSYLKKQRLDGPSAIKTDPPLILQSVIDILQYEVFCDRIKSEIDTMVFALTRSGVECTFHFHPVGQVGDELVKLLDDRLVNSVGGQCILRIDKRHSIRFSFSSPSTLTAHLPQATLTISSIPHLAQLLRDDVATFLLERICEMGREIASDVGGLWFLDLNRCIGKWEGCVLYVCFRFLCILAA
ncbi:hypothetical protein BDZ89DRAFT_1087997 [Hymenopellis radicata]|nr:hypothetical protein BDZ89DRAFT_1087997 [Hymenopellis radicata]